MTVFASVGTDVHPFDRLVGWVDEWAGRHADLETVVQYGTSAAPVAAHGVEYLSHEGLLSWLTQAKVVICHGGPATIMEVRARHGRPIVVPRNPDLGEHVDQHQMDFCRMLARRGDIDMALSPEHLEGLIGTHLATTATPLNSNGSTPDGVVRFTEVVGELLDRDPPGRTK